MNEIPKFEDMPLSIRTEANYIKVLKAWVTEWKKETEQQIKELKEFIAKNFVKEIKQALKK